MSAYQLASSRCFVAFRHLFGFTVCLNICSACSSLLFNSRICCKGAFFNSATFGMPSDSGDDGAAFLQSDDEGMTMHLLFIPLSFMPFFGLQDSSSDEDLYDIAMKSPIKEHCDNPDEIAAVLFGRSGANLNYILLFKYTSVIFAYRIGGWYPCRILVYRSWCIQHHCKGQKWWYVQSRGRKIHEECSQEEDKVAASLIA